MVLTDLNYCESGDPRSKSESLLTKYQIPIQHLDFDYVEKCQDTDELEKILKILRSKQEGFYPELISATENRLRVLKPKSKLLRVEYKVRKSEDLTRQERDEVSKDLSMWLDDVSKHDQTLSVRYKNQKRRNSELPEVRESREFTMDEAKTIKKPKAATDYNSWDKYDADTEILKMDLEEEQLKSSLKKENKNAKTVKKIVKFNEFNEIEAEREAHYEKEKGNESFKANDLEESLQHYTNSISLKPSAAAFSNRALVNLKLKQYKNALDDCYSALCIEPSNTKALVRKAAALESLNHNEKALETVEKVIELVPNNGFAQEMATRLRSKCNVIAKNTRIAIEDIDSSQKAKRYIKNSAKEKRKSDGRVLIPIPGTSHMPPPYFVECTESNAEKIRQAALQINSQSHAMHLVTIEHDDEDECCLVNHFEKKCAIETDEKASNSELSQRELQRNELNKQKASSRVLIKEAIEEDKQAGGEPYIQQDDGNEMPEDINSPYSFLKAWNTGNSDATHEQHAQILRNLDANRLVQVFGCKLGNAMFTSILQCLRVHFSVPSEVIRLHAILTNIVDLPRFDIVAMLMSDEDKQCIHTLVNFLNQHGKSLSRDTANKLF